MSRGSPFARRVRIVLAEKQLDHEEDIYDRVRPIEAIAPLNPALSIPVLVDGDRKLFDSTLIVSYLMETYPETGTERPPLSRSVTRPEHHWEDAQVLVALETLMSTIVNLRLLGADGVWPQNSQYMARHMTRIDHLLDWIEERVTPQGFVPGEFSIMDMNLICPLDFAEVRGIADWRGRKNVDRAFEHWQSRPSVATTRPVPV